MRFWLLRRLLLPVPVIGLAVALLGPAGAVAAARLEIKPADCRFLARHQPGDDVAYRPGVDVHGKPVAPADIGGAPALVLPRSFTIDIEIDLRKRFGIPADSPLFRDEANIGVVEVRGDELYFNGQRLDGPERAAVSAACRERIAPKE